MIANAYKHRGLDVPGWVERDHTIRASVLLSQRRGARTTEPTS